jgi:hypothetical protein
MRWSPFALGLSILVGCSSGHRAASPTTAVGPSHPLSAAARAAVRDCVSANGPDLGGRLQSGAWEAVAAARQVCSKAVTAVETEVAQSRLAVLLKDRLDSIEQARFAQAQRDYAVLSATTAQKCQQLGPAAPATLHCELFAAYTGPSPEELFTSKARLTSLDFGFATWAPAVEDALKVLDQV